MSSIPAICILSLVTLQELSIWSSYHRIILFAAFGNPRSKFQECLVQDSFVDEFGRELIG